MQELSTLECRECGACLRLPLGSACPTCRLVGEYVQLSIINDKHSYVEDVRPGVVSIMRSSMALDGYCSIHMMQEQENG